MELLPFQEAFRENTGERNEGQGQDDIRNPIDPTSNPGKVRLEL